MLFALVWMKRRKTLKTWWTSYLVLIFCNHSSKHHASRSSGWKERMMTSLQTLRLSVQRRLVLYVWFICALYIYLCIYSYTYIGYIYRYMFSKLVTWDALNNSTNIQPFWLATAGAQDTIAEGPSPCCGCRDPQRSWVVKDLGGNPAFSILMASGMARFWGEPNFGSMIAHRGLMNMLKTITKESCLKKTFLNPLML